MVNYQNGKIYKIINESNDIVYIGSTTNTLCRRYHSHNHKAINHKIILIENYPCNGKEELCKREQEIIEENDNLLNKFKAYISEEQKKESFKEYRNNNKDKVIIWRQTYRIKNKQKIKDYQNEKVFCECGCEVHRNNLIRHRKTTKHKLLMEQSE